LANHFLIHLSSLSSARSVAFSTADSGETIDIVRMIGAFVADDETGNPFLLRKMGKL